MVSIQGEVPAPGQACSRVKFTITSKDAKQFTNVFAKPTPTPGNWHRFAAWIDAEAGTASVQLDDGEVVTLPLAVSVDILKDIKFTLGATGLKGSTRGFSGAIRNLDISTGPTVDLDPASAAANAAIDLSKAELAPGAAYADGALSFKATADTATPARLPGSFDFSRGGKIELEFLDGGEQTNPFPRLLEGGGLSLHFESTPGHADKTMKFLLTGDDAQRYHQVLVPVRHRPGVWRKATATYSPGAGEITLQVDDEQLATVPCDIAPAKADKISFVLGARAFKNNDNRGFSGSIRNLSVTTPYGPAGTPGAAKRQIEAPTVNGEPVEHITISAVKNRHSAFPGVTRMPNGDLAVVFREGEAHVCPYGRICLVLSKDGGKNWSAPIAVADTASDERDPSIQTLPDGRVLISHGGWNSWMYYENTAKNFPGESAYINQAGPEKFGGSRYIFSTDNGETWSRPIKVKGFAPHGPAYVNGKFYQPSLGSDNGKRQVNMFIGNSDATEWEGPFLVGESELGLVSVVPVFEEPHTVALADGTLVTAIRVPSDGYMRISRSTDGGKSWSEPVKTPVRGFPQHLLPVLHKKIIGCRKPGSKFPGEILRTSSAAVPGRRNYVIAVVAAVEHLQRSHLLEVAETFDLQRLAAGFIESGQQHGGENCDDRDNYEEFDKGKKTGSFSHFHAPSFFDDFPKKRIDFILSVI